MIDLGVWNTARPIFVPCRIALTIDALNVYEWIVRKIVSKIVSKMVRFLVDNSENWRIVLAVERMSQLGVRMLKFYKSVMLFLVMPMMSVFLPIEFFKNGGNLK